MSGLTHDIDVLATQGTKVLAVECKNYDEVRFVGMSFASTRVHLLSCMFKITHYLFHYNICNWVWIA